MSHPLSQKKVRATQSEDTSQSLDLIKFFDYETTEHLFVIQKTQQLMGEVFTHIVNMAVETIQNGGKLIFFGNGGSAGDSQHLATECTIKYNKERAPIAAIALTTDTSALTAGANDYGYDHVFSRQLSALGKPEDLAIGISTSGNSKNVNLALQTAREMGMKTVGLSGRDGGSMPPLCDEIVIVPSQTTARIQEMHIMLGQMIIGALEIQLGLISAETVNPAYKALLQS